MNLVSAFYERLALILERLFYFAAIMAFRGKFLQTLMARYFNTLHLYRTLCR